MRGQVNFDRPEGAEGLPVRQVARDDTSSYGVWRRVFVCFGRGPPGLAEARTFRRAAMGFLAEQSKPSGFLMVLRRASVPVPEARSPAIEVFKAMAESGVRAMAIVVEAEGFVAATQRSIATAFLLTTMRRTEVRVFKHVRDATSWLVPRVYADARGSDARCLSTGIRQFMEEESRDSPSTGAPKPGGPASGSWSAPGRPQRRDP